MSPAAPGTADAEEAWLPGPAVVPPVVVVGDLMSDVVARLSGPLALGSDTPSHVSVHGGGSAANVAAWLALTGAPVAYVGRAGADAAADAAVAELAAYGIRCHVALDPDLPTGTCLVLVTPDGERTMLPDPGANAALAPADVPRGLFRPGRHLHLSGYSLIGAGSRDAALAALALAREHRMSVSVDPSSAAPLRDVGPDRFLAWTAGVDVVLANRDEARVLTGRADPRAAAAALAETYREAVVTCGGAGAVWHGGFISARSRAEEVELVDTTGAGDAFAAGFLAEWLVHPEPETALAGGHRAAARAVATVGARPRTPLH
jgi:sugar/nucleoside kinase (ribokinase family)